MFSKGRLFISSVFLILAGIAMTACDLPLNELPPESDPIVIDLGTSSECLSHISPAMSAYFDGVANDAQVSATWDCMVKAIQTFEESVKGRYEDRFTARELAHFLEQYFLEEGTRIPDPLLKEAFRIKQLFVGGSDQFITREEMKNLEDVIGSLKAISLNLNPYMKVYTFNWQQQPFRATNYHAQHFELANAAIQKASVDLGDLIQRNGMAYRIEFASSFLRELSVFNGGNWLWVSEVEKAIPLVQKLKKSLVSGDETEIAPHEWRRFGLLAGRGFIQYLRYYYFIKMNEEAGNSSQLVFFTRSIDDLFSYLGDMVEGKPEQKLTREELLEMLQSLTVFVPKLKISDELLIEAMKIKVVLFGGRVDWFVKSDFDRARDKLEAFRVLTEEFLNHSDIYGLSWKPHLLPEGESKARFRLAENSLRSVAQQLGRQMENPYDLQSLIHLAEEIDKLYPSPDRSKKSLSQMAHEFVPVLITFKNILFSDEGSMIGWNPTRTPSQQWTEFLNATSQVYSRYLYYEYFLKNISLSGEKGLDEVQVLLEDSFEFLSTVAQRKPEKIISQSELLKALEAVQEMAPDFKFSQKLLDEAMKVKIALVGGTVQGFTAEDLNRTRTKLKKLRWILGQFFNHSEIYNQSWKPDSMPNEQSRSQFREAEKSLKGLAFELGLLMEGAYDLRGLIPLTDELAKLYPNPEGDSGSHLQDMVQKFLPVLISFKNILFSDEGSIVGWAGRSSAQKQWSVFLQSISELYTKYLYYSYFLKDRSITAEPGLSDLEVLSGDTLNYLNDLLSQKPENLISNREIQNLLVAFKNSDLLPEKISLHSLKVLTNALIQKILIAPEKRLAGQKPSGWSLETNQQLRYELMLWIQTQKKFAGFFQGVSESDGKSTSEILNDLNAMGNHLGAQELKMIYANPIPLSTDLLDRMFFGQPPLNYRYSVTAQINMVRAAVRLMIRSYAMDLNRIQTYQGITESEAESFYQDVKPLVVDLDLLSPENTEFAKNRFRDANLFTPVGNGDKLVNFKEGSNLFMMILSGLKLDEMMFDRMVSVCPVQKASSSKDDWKADVNCVMNFYHQYMPSVFKSMPDFMKYQVSLSLESFQNFFLNLLKSAGYVPNSSGKVRISDLSLYPHVAQYVEGIFQTYDTDRSGTLITPEAMKAYPTYRSILIEVSDLKDEQQIKGLFTWLLKYGKPPTSAGDKIKFITYWVPMGEAGWKVEADRGRLATILGFIADALANPKKQSLFLSDVSR